jgi:DNA-binding response OmpR family regulator
VYQEVHRGRPSEHLVEGLVESFPPKIRPVPESRPVHEAQQGRAVIVERHPAVQAVLEHTLLQEGYAVKTYGEAAQVTPERAPVLLLVGAENGEGLYVFRTHDVSGVLATLSEGANLSGSTLSTFGIHAFLPKPFGIVDILRIICAVAGFDGRKKGSPRKKS